MFKPLSRKYFIFLILSAFSIIRAQEPVFKNFNTLNGLPSNEVYYLYQDSKKYIWICTDAGIVKYNANSFKTFNSANGLPDNTIFEVKEDRTGKIWFRSFSGKMGFIYNDTVVCPESNTKILEFISDGIVCSFAFDKNNTLYLGKRNSETISFLKIKWPYSADDVSEIWQDKSITRGISIIRVDSEIVFSDVRGAPTIPYSVRIINEKNEVIFKEDIDIKNTTLQTSAIVSGNKIVLGANNFLYEIDYLNGTTHVQPFPSIILSLSRVHGKIAAGLRLNGFRIIEPEEEYNISLPQKLSVTSVAGDYQKGIWVSTLEKGVFYLSPDPVIALNASENEGEFITCITPFNSATNEYLVGYNTGKLALLKLNNTTSESRELIRADEKKAGQIIAIYKINSSSVIVSGPWGTIKLDPANISRKESLSKNVFFDPPRQIIKYGDSLLFLYIKALKVYSGKSDVKTILSSRHRLNSITYDSINKKLYIGSLQGFYQYTGEKTIEENKKILDCRVQDAIIKNGDIYIATKNNGLMVMRNKGIDTVSVYNGLLSNICNAVNIRNNEVWVSTNKGLGKIERAGRNYKITNFPISSFLSAPSVSKVMFSRERVMFFSEDRMFTFSDKRSVSEGLVRISSMTANNQVVSITQPVSFKYNQNEIVVNFEAMFYDHGGLILYRYKLTKNEDWHYTTQPSAHFPSPSYGNYNFILQACDRSGKWVNSSNSLQFTVEKPIWMNLWFIVFVIVVLSFSTAAYIRYRFETTLRKEQEKNNLTISVYELESRIAKAQMNPHFIFNALNSIQQFILGKDNESAYRYLSKFAKLIRKLLETNTRESILLDDEIDLIKRYIEIESLRFEDSFLYEIETDEKLLKKGIHIPHMLVQPFIENAIWHGLRGKHENKNLTIVFREHTSQTLICIVEDNGVGRDLRKSELKNRNLDKKSLALDLIRQRMDLICKTRQIQCGFEIIDKKDKHNRPAGTCVKIVIPILKHEFTQSDNN